MTSGPSSIAPPEPVTCSAPRPSFEAYRQSVATISQAAADCGAALGWIGLPNMRDDRFAAAAARLNAVMCEGAEAAGGTFIPTWAATSDEQGRFRASVSDGGPGGAAAARR